MTALTTIVALLAVIAIFSAWRVVRARRPHAALLAAGQFALALALYATLYPPLRPAAGETLVLLTPGATAEQVAALPAGARVVALPGTAAPSTIARVPDLGTALRAFPSIAALHVVGGGLPARDRDAARGLPVRFDAAELPRGVVELSSPYAVRAGSVWRVRGRVHGIDGGRVELVDPGEGIAASSDIVDGKFVLAPTARIAGETVYKLRVLGKDDAVIDTVDVAVVTRAGEPLRAMLLAANPNPELKYLRRWASDAGVRIDARIGLTPGVALRDGDARPVGASLAQADVAIVDERAWSALGAAGQGELVRAVRDGLGLILMVRGPLPGATAQALADLGMRTAPAEGAAAVALDAALTLDPRDRLGFSRQLVAVDTPDASPLLSADDGTAVAWWAAAGRGRVALWTLTDSYRLTLSGRAERFGTLWSQVFETIARARGVRVPSLPVRALASERTELCGLPPGASIDGTALSPTRDARACVGWSPASTGWHRTDEASGGWPIHVAASDATTALAAAQRRLDTERLVHDSRSESAQAQPPARTSRWPFAAVWLALATLLWWLERRPAAARIR